MNNHRRKVTAFFAAFLLLELVALSAQAATIYTNDGEQLHGTIVSATARDMQIVTEKGPVTVPSEKILRVDYQDAGTPPSETAAPPPRRRRYEPEVPSYQPENQMFSLNIGMAAPLSNISFSDSGGGSTSNGDAGFLIGTQYVYYTSPRMGLGLDLEFFNRSDNNSSGLLPAADTAVNGNSLLLMPILRYTLTKRGSVRPYVMAGIGMNRTSTVIDAAPVPGFEWSDTSTDETRRLIDDTHWGLATTARLGLDFYYAEPALFSFEVGWTGISNKRYEPTQAGRDLGLGSVTGRLDELMISGRWGWKF